MFSDFIKRNISYTVIPPLVRTAKIIHFWNVRFNRFQKNLRYFLYKTEWMTDWQWQPTFIIIFLFFNLHHHGNAIWINVKSITNAINEVIHEKYDRFMYLIKHFLLLSIDFPSCKKPCKLSSTERPYQIMWPLTVADTYKDPQLHFSIDASFMCNSHKQNWVLMTANVILLILVFISSAN